MAALGPVQSGQVVERGGDRGVVGPERLPQECQGLFVAAPIRARWQAHLEGANWAYPLWNVLMAQAWLNANPGVAL